MSLYTAPNISNGLDDALISTFQTVSIFVPMLLVFTFCVIFFSGMISQKRRIGYSDAPMWAVISSLSVLMIALTLTLSSTKILNVGYLGIVITITVASGIWFFLDQNKNE